MPCFGDTIGGLGSSAFFSARHKSTLASLIARRNNVCFHRSGINNSIAPSSSKILPSSLTAAISWMMSAKQRTRISSIRSCAAMPSSWSGSIQPLLRSRLFSVAVVGLFILDLDNLFFFHRDDLVLVFIGGEFVLLHDLQQRVSGLLDFAAHLPGLVIQRVVRLGSVVNLGDGWRIHTVQVCLLYLGHFVSFWLTKSFSRNIGHKLPRFSDVA